MRKNSLLYASCIRKCGRDTCKEDGICPACYEKEANTPTEKPQGAGMKRYEYAVEYLGNENHQKRTGRLNELGSMGWRLVGIDCGHYVFIKELRS